MAAIVSSLGRLFTSGKA
jgi:hypothetical protein